MLMLLSNSEEMTRVEKETRTFQKTGGGRNRRRPPARGSLSALFVHPRRRRHGHLFFLLYVKDFKQPSSLTGCHHTFLIIKVFA